MWGKKKQSQSLTCDWRMMLPWVPDGRGYAFSDWLAGANKSCSLCVCLEVFGSDRLWRVYLIVVCVCVWWLCVMHIREGFTKLQSAVSSCSSLHCLSACLTHFLLLPSLSPSFVISFCPSTPPPSILSSLLPLSLSLALNPFSPYSFVCLVILTSWMNTACHSFFLMFIHFLKSVSFISFCV